MRILIFISAVIVLVASIVFNPNTVTKAAEQKAKEAAKPASGEQGQKTNDKVNESDEKVRITKTEVTLPVIVTDKDGRFVSNLTQQNFEVYEDKVPQKIND